MQEEMLKMNDSLMMNQNQQNSAKNDLNSLFDSLEEKFNADIKAEEKARSLDKEKIYSLLDQTLQILEGALENEIIK